MLDTTTTTLVQLDENGNFIVGNPANYRITSIPAQYFMTPGKHDKSSIENTFLGLFPGKTKLEFTQDAMAFINTLIAQGNK